ncbi:MAG: FAD-dependent oxidoreductase [Rhodobacteraceae bacterium]|nr:FAD-dependent oxidoreductase [Paracoccaceae bacterium]
MSFDAPNTSRQRIAIVGGGISGLAAAYLLAPQHDVTLYEAEPRLGGHARTVTAGVNGDQPVDTGFIVFNYVNYPHLTAMFDDLDVPVEKSEMSFGATIDNGSVEYGLRTLGAILGQRRNLVRPGFLAMIRDILKFNAMAERVAQSDDVTIGEMVDELQLGKWFQRYYLMPISGAIWSTPPDEVRSFPARTLVQFFKNHSLLSARKQHQWYTVSGGSIEYVKRLETRLRLNGVTFRLGAPVQNVKRDTVGVTIKTAEYGAEHFDQVILASHSDDTLRMLENPTAAEQAALSNINYQDNQMILHRDERQMPRRRACWSSWVYKAEGDQDQAAIGVTYWMNQLQNIPQNDPLFISLNPVSPVRDELIYDQKTFRHPVFDRAALAAQSRIAGIQGQNNTWFAGAYLRHGFHEDGFYSAVRVAELLNTQSVKIAA